MASRPGVVAHTVIPALWEAEMGRSPEVRRSRPPGQYGENPSLLKYKKISWVWWRATVVPATQEAEAWESLEPGKQRLQWTKNVPLNSSLGNTVRHHLKKQNKKRTWTLFLRAVHQLKGCDRQTWKQGCPIFRPPRATLEELSWVTHKITLTLKIADELKHTHTHTHTHTP